MPNRFKIDEDDRQRYRQEGYHILRQVIPPALLKDLRREAAKAREIAWRVNGPQAQRLAPLGDYADELDMRVFKRFEEIDGLADAIQSLLSPAHFLRPSETSCILFSPRERPWSTEWHRDWRDHVVDSDFNEHVGDEMWHSIVNNFNFWNQVNCPLYEDSSTWYVPGSFQRVENTEEEIALFASTNQDELRDSEGKMSDEELELFCLDYCQRMPGAVQLVLNPGDFCIYRNVGWHIGNYVPYRERMTLHTHCLTEEWSKFGENYGHLLNAGAASKEKHAKLASTT